MALFDNGIKIGTGLAIGIGVLILAPAVFPVAASIVKPLAKASIKTGMLLFEKTRELAAEAKESLEDLAAEAHAELSEDRLKAHSPLAGAEESANVQ